MKKKLIAIFTLICIILTSLMTTKQVNAEERVTKITPSTYCTLNIGNKSFPARWVKVYGPMTPSLGYTTEWMVAYSDVKTNLTDANIKERLESYKSKVPVSMYRDSYGWCRINTKWYYLWEGLMITGWAHIGKHSSGSYQLVEGTTYGGFLYKMENKYGIKNIHKYYFNNSGIMQTGWKKMNGLWYYFGSDGAMRTGWQRISGEWYFFRGDGSMKTGWLKNGGKWYFLSGNGHAVINTSKLINGKIYRFDSSGVCLNP